jgi:hypothetical protein
MAFKETPHESSLELDRKIAYSILIGAFLTLVSSIIPNNTAIGASNFGFPFPWLSYPLYPIGSPPSVIWTAFGIDVILLILIAFVIVSAYQFLKSR